MPWGALATAGLPAIINGIAAWLMDDSDDEEKRRELDAQLEREKRRLPPWAYARLKSLLTGPVTPSGLGGDMGAGAPAGGAGASQGAFQRVLGGGGGMGAPRAPGGISPRIMPPAGSAGLPERNPQLRTFLRQ